MTEDIGRTLASTLEPGSKTEISLANVSMIVMKKRKEISQALILSVVKYNAEFYGRETQHHGNLQVSIKKVARSLLGESYEAQVKPMLKESSHDALCIQFEHFP